MAEKGKKKSRTQRDVTLLIVGGIIGALLMWLYLAGAVEEGGFKMWCKDKDTGEEYICGAGMVTEAGSIVDGSENIGWIKLQLTALNPGDRTTDVTPNFVGDFATAFTSLTTKTITPGGSASWQSEWIDVSTLDGSYTITGNVDWVSGVYDGTATASKTIVIKPDPTLGITVSFGYDPINPG